MVQNILFKILLSPISLLYGVGVSLRDLLYRVGLLKGVAFDVPVISVGNLSIGGAGKTPHIEYLVRLLKDYINVVTLSRGYKRETKGFLIGRRGHDARVLGDEPLQFLRKFPDILVTVAESRSLAIPQILMKAPGAQAILLDDAFQHRSVEPSLNILLTEYDRPFVKDFLLPSGRLREWRSAYRRADMIVVSKCPPVLSEADRQAMIRRIRPYAHQRVFFSYYQYGLPYFIWNAQQRLRLGPQMQVLLICAIAGTDYLLDWLKPQVEQVIALEYEDHHFFSKFDLGKLQRTFERMEGQQKLILTTEKDAMRLELHRDFLTQQRLPIFVLPVQVAFHSEDRDAFDQSIRDSLLNFKA
ncbi:MAG: tetraacyldisaccharide 4'-kinase [Bacteroidota bacterium]